MRYRIYAYNYEYGWEIYGEERKLKFLYDTINKIDPYEYGQYIVVKKHKDRDEPFLNGTVAKPKGYKLKPSKKH